MAHSGGIFAIHPAPFKFDLEDFKAALVRQWPDVQFHNDTRGGIDFGMTLKGKFKDFLGSAINNDSIMWWADYEEFAEFIIWYRNYVPNEYQLLAHSKNFSNYLLISPTTSEMEVLRGLSGNRYAFELVCPIQDLNTRQIFEENFNQSWPDGFFAENGTKGVTWFLKSQQGYIGLDNNSIHFSDNDLDFASQFAVWTCKTLNSNLRLIAKSDSATHIEFAVSITVKTTPQELLKRINEEFQPNEK